MQSERQDSTYPLLTLLFFAIIFIPAPDAPLTAQQQASMIRIHSSQGADIPFRILNGRLLHESDIFLRQPVSPPLPTSMHSNADFHPLPGPQGATVRGITYSDNGWLFAATDGGIYRSEDNGEHWQSSLLPSQFYNFLEPVTVLFPNVIAAETDYFTTVSRDNGVTWNYLPNSVRGFAVDSTGVIYAGSGNGGLYRSNDSAKSWTQYSLSGKNIYRVILAGPGKIVCVADSGNYYSSNSGTTWQFRSHFANEAWNPVADHQGHLFAVRYDTLMRSDNFGATWKAMHNITAATPNGIYRTYCGKDDKLYLLLDHSIVYSSDAGQTITTIPFSHDYSLTAGPDANGALLAGGFNGIYRYDSLAGKWNSISTGMHGMRISYMAHSSSGTIFVMSSGIGFKSTDGGENWQTLPFSSLGTIFPYGPILVTAAGSVLTTAGFIGGAGLIRSTNNGDSWSTINLPGNNYAVYSLAQGKNGVLFAGTSFGDIYRSTDDGAAWTKVYSTGFHTAIGAISADPAGFCYAMRDSFILRSEDGIAWTPVLTGRRSYSFNSLCTDSRGRVFAGGSGYVSVSLDHGKSWKDMMNGLTDSYIMSMAADDSGNVFVGGASRVQRLADSVDRWENFSDGYPGTFTMCLGVSAAGYVYAGTQSYGMYKTGSPVHPRIKEVPLPPPPPPPVYFFDLQQNYPNPFNGSTQLEYALPKRSTVNISIFDILGRRVAVLVSEEQPDGRYTIAWQPKQEATGMYYCTLTIRDGSRTYSKTVKILYVR